MVIGDTGNPISLKRLVIHMACQQQSEITMYSASVEERAMVFWARESHETDDFFFFKLAIYSVVLVRQSVGCT